MKYLVSIWLFGILVVSMAAHTYAKYTNNDNDFVAKETFVQEFHNGGDIYDWLSSHGYLITYSAYRSRLLPTTTQGEKWLEERYPNNYRRILPLVQKFHYTLVLQLVFIAVTWPIFLYLFSTRFRNTLSEILSNWCTMALLTVLFLSGFYSATTSQLPFISTGYFLAIFLVIVTSLSFNLVLSNEELRQSLVTYGLLAGIMVISYLLYHTTDLRRSMDMTGFNVLNPNELGMISVSIIMTSFLNKNIFGKVVALIPMLVVLYITGSRSSIIGLMIGTVIWMSRSKFNWLSVVPIVGAMIAVFCLYHFYHKTNMGMSRLQLWLQAWNYFRYNSLTGIGQHMCEYRLNTSVDNSYFQILADTGIFGGCCLLYLILGSISNFWQHNKEPLSVWAIGFLMANLFIGMFESYFFTTGNCASVLIVFILVRGLLYEKETLCKA